MFHKAKIPYTHLHTPHTRTSRMQTPNYVDFRTMTRVYKCNGSWIYDDGKSCPPENVRVVTGLGSWVDEKSCLRAPKHTIDRIIKFNEESKASLDNAKNLHASAEEYLKESEKAYLAAQTRLKKAKTYLDKIEQRIKDDQASHDYQTMLDLEIEKKEQQRKDVPQDSRDEQTRHQDRHALCLESRKSSLTSAEKVLVKWNKLYSDSLNKDAAVVSGDFRLSEQTEALGKKCHAAEKALADAKTALAEQEKVVRDAQEESDAAFARQVQREEEERAQQIRDDAEYAASQV